MTFGTFSGGADKVGAQLLGFDLRPRAIQQECCENQSESNYDSNEYGSKRHLLPLPKQACGVARRDSLRHCSWVGDQGDRLNACGARTLEFKLSDMVHVPND